MVELLALHLVTLTATSMLRILMMTFTRMWTLTTDQLQRGRRRRRHHRGIPRNIMRMLIALQHSRRADQELVDLVLQYSDGDDEMPPENCAIN